MKIDLIDYEKHRKEFVIGDLEGIAKIDIRVISGDEIADVEYKDGTVRHFYSLPHDYFWFKAYYDGEYEIYNSEVPEEDNLIFNGFFLNRKDSYEAFKYGF